jgi:hypothetical protein
MGRQRDWKSGALGDSHSLLHHVGDLGRQDNPLHHRRGLREGRASQRAARAPGLIARVRVEDASVDQALQAQHALHLGTLPVDLLGDTVHADQERRAVGASKLQGAKRLAVGEIEGRGQEIRAHHRARSRAGLLEAGEARDNQTVRVRTGPELHRHLDDHAESPERPDEKLRQIVSRDVFDHLAATLDERARRRDHGQPDDEIAAGAIEVAPRSGRIAGDDAAKRRFVGVWRVERQPLAARAELALERAQGHARLDGGSEIAGLVLEKPVEPPQRQHEAQAQGRSADAHPGAAAPRRHRVARLRRRQQDGRDFLLASGEHDRLGGAAIQNVRTAVRPGKDVGGTDDGAELV